MNRQSLASFPLKVLASVLATLLVVLGVPSTANAVAAAMNDAEYAQALEFSNELAAKSALALMVDYSAGSIGGGTESRPDELRPGKFDVSFSYDPEAIDSTLPQGARYIYVGFDIDVDSATIAMDLDGAMEGMRGIKSIEGVDGRPGLMKITFVDDFSVLEDENGDFIAGEQFDFTADLNITGVGVDAGTINWTGKDKPSNILIVGPGAEKVILNETTQNKFVDDAAVRNLVTSTYKNGETSITVPDLKGKTFDYKVVRETVAGGDFSIEDAIDVNWLDVIPGSLKVEVKSYEAIEHGYAIGKTTTETYNYGDPRMIATAGGQKISASIPGIPDNSVITVTYQAEITKNQARYNAMVADLTAKHGAAKPLEDVKVLANNTADVTVGTHQISKSAVTGISVRKYNAPGVTGVGFTKGLKDPKQFTWPTFADFDREADDTLVDPLNPTYTFKFDLRGLDPTVEADDKRRLGINTNVIFTDTLPAGTTWDLESDTITVKRGAETVTFTKATTAEVGVNQYAIVKEANGRETLRMNFGKDNVYHEFVFEARVVIETMPKYSPPLAPSDYQQHQTTNRAGVAFNAGSGVYIANWTPQDYEDIIVIDRVPTTEKGEIRDVNDPSTFSKTTPNSLVAGKPGQPAKVEYNFSVGRSSFDKEIDVRSTNIVDYIDTDTFVINQDLSNVGITGTYPGVNGLAAADFALTWDATAKTLVIKLSEAGIAKVGDGSGRLIIKLILETRDLKHGEVVAVENTAEYHGSRATEGYYVSSAESNASSSGARLYYSKAAYDWTNGVWAKNLRVPHDADGAPVNVKYTEKGYLYRITTVVPANYRGVFPTLTDTLGDGGLKFVGFVNSANDLTAKGSNTLNLGRGVTVKYANGKVTMETGNKQIGTVNANGETVFRAYYLAVPAKKVPNDTPITNSVNKASTNVTVTNRYPLSIAKTDSSVDELTAESTEAEVAAKVITDLDARFTVAHVDQPEKYTYTNVAVQNGNLVMVAEDGTVGALLVDAPGDYTITEVVAPKGYYLTDKVITASVDERGVTEEVTFENTPSKMAPVSIAKVVKTGPTQSFVFNWTAKVPAGILLPGKTPGANNTYTDTAVVVGGATVHLGEFPVGTKISVTENTPQNVAGFDFVSVDGISNEITITEANKPVTFTATNTYTPYVSVGDYVWYDADRDGVQGGENDTPIAGVELQLVDPDGKPVVDVDGKTVANVITDEDGAYSFERLPVLDGQKVYTVKVVENQDVLKPYAPAPKNTTDRDKDSDTAQASSQPGGLATGGKHDPTLDFGFVDPSYAIGDVVWIDIDRDGLQGDNEKPLAGVTVTLLDAATGAPVTKDITGAAINPVQTNDKGLYMFDNLPAGSYKVSFELTEKQGQTYMFTKNVDGTDSTDNSDGVVADNKRVATTGDIVLNKDTKALTNEYDRTVKATQGIDPTWDAGVHLKNVSLGDTVWVDNNRDGLQDAGEPGIPNVMLELVRVDVDGKEHPVVDVYGDEVEPEVTNSEGFYQFTDLPALENGEQYKVTINHEDPATEEALKPYVPTLKEQGDDRAKDSNTDFAVATAEGLQEDKGHNPTLDFGFVTKSYAVGDYVWIDANRDGIQDDSEEILENVTVELFVENADGELVPAVDVLGAEIGVAVTDDQGRYMFDNLPAGNYQVQFTLTEAQSEIYDFTSVNSEDSAVWNDSDAHAQDKEDGATRTVASTVVFALDDSNDERVKDYDRDFVATQGVDPTWDAGVHLKKVSIGNRVWVDETRDGLQDTNNEGTYTEPGIPGVKLVVTLVDRDGNPVVDGEGNPVVVTDVFGNVVEPQVTNDNGEYLFEELPALPTGQQYKVTIDTTDEGTIEALSPYVPTLENQGDDQAADSSTGSELAPWNNLQTDGAEDLTLDFGFYAPSYAIGDYTWIDVNRDGIQDATEQPLAGVTVTLLNAETGEPVATDIAGNEIAPQVTDETGRYFFDNLPAGSYKVSFELTEDQAKKYQFTANVDGTNSVDNSDGLVLEDPRVAITNVIVLDSTNTALTTDYDREFIATAGVDPTWDAGVHLKKVSVGDYVWLDDNKNGVQDKKEKGLEGVKLVLTDKEGNPVVDVYGNEVAPVWTDSKGKYTFENLPVLLEGEEYRVKIDRKDDSTKLALEHLKPTTEGSGDEATDSSTWLAIATSTGLTEDGNRNPTLDFGFVLDPSSGNLGDEEETDDTIGDSVGKGDGDKLPDTGFSGTPIAIAAAMLLAIGGLLMAMRRRVK